MELQDAKTLIAGDPGLWEKPGRWADLGCGRGLFTQALGQLLPGGSRVYAVDSSKAALAKVPQLPHGIMLEKMIADFTDPLLPLQQLDGILMANALHFVKDQEHFLRRAVSWLQPDGCFLMVEYDMDKGNYWVPYPVSYTKLRSLFHAIGYLRIEKLHERPSIYQRGAIYSALVRKA